jgi:hypothetical protein
MSKVADSRASRSPIRPDPRGLRRGHRFRAELERSHLCGPTAGLIQARRWPAGASGAELSQPDETVTLRMKVSGPIGGLWSKRPNPEVCAATPRSK